MEMLSKLINELKNTDPRIRLIAASKISELGRDAAEAVPAIIELLEREEILMGSSPPPNESPLDRMTREQAIIPKQATLTLSKIGNVDVLSNLLKHQVGLVRLAAVEALGTIGPSAKDSQASLAMLAAFDINDHIRIAAATALKKILVQERKFQKVDTKKKSWKFWK